MGEYKYTPLAIASDDIRLVTLLAGTRNDPIQLEIFHTPLMTPIRSPGIVPSLRPMRDIRKSLPIGLSAYESVDGDVIIWDSVSKTSSYSHPNPNLPTEHNQSETLQHTHRVEYEALSYIWGANDSDEAVEIRPKSRRPHVQHTNYIWVGRNLAEALRYLRSSHHPRTLWIDALCINQENIEERGQQVTRMGQIYTLASKVVAWIGPSFSNANSALSAIEYLGKQVEVTKDLWFVPRPNCDQPKWYHPKVSLPYDDQTWDAIAELCWKPWFQRLWVLQEIHLGSRRSIIKCGEQDVEWALFRCAILCIDNKLDDVPDQVRDAINEVRKICDYTFASSLENFLGDHMIRKCRDDRDRVYGLMNLLPPGLAKLIQVDYSKSAIEVFEHFILVRISQVQRLELLKYCCLYKTQGATWVPNWTWNTRLAVPDILCFLASGRSAAVTKLITAGVLEVSAIHIGNVQLISDLGCGTISDIARFLKKLGLDQLESCSYYNGESRLDAYLRAFTLGLLGDSRLGYHYPTLSELRRAVLELAEAGDLSIETGISSLYEYHIKVWLEGSCLFCTEEGYVGTTRIGAKPNDQVFVILGCNIPMLLRLDRTGCYRVVGDCYVSGFMEGEAVLGKLPPKWHVVGRKGEEGLDIPYYCNRDTGAELIEDPRLGKLPSDWEPFSWRRTRDDPRFCSKFRNINTGVVINSDPRLTPESLRERGVDVQSIMLV
ncbi:HET-domain-containing protein [Xylariaceae sp. AK1471]|nr:HET-domain-containing protein [Xylariaceae sp. AK1471]